MKRREVLLLFGFFILFILLIILYFYPQQKWNKDHSPEHGVHNDAAFLEMLREKLDLSDEQFIAISVVFKKDEAVRNDYRARIAEKLKVLDSYMLEDEFNEPGVRKVLEEVDVLKREERILIMEKKYEIVRFLSPEQKMVMDDDMRNKMKRFRERVAPEQGRLPEND